MPSFDYMLELQYLRSVQPYDFFHQWDKLLAVVKKNYINMVAKLPRI